MIVTVCTAGCAYSSLAAAVGRVPAGSEIVVRGTVAGGAIVDRRIVIRGENGALITGGDSGIVVRAPRTVVENLRFTGYALDDPSGRNAAVVLAARDATVRDNVFDGNAFAVTTARADGSRIEGNVIRGGDDAIRLWYTANAVVTGNTVSSGRDILISYSPNLIFENNVVLTSRYGLHDMFSNGMRVRGNRFEGNEIGANFMYAANLEISGNTFRANRGAAGYGMSLEDVDATAVRNNRFLQNRIAMNCIDSPSDPRAADTVEGNLFAQNGSALSLQSNPHALAISGNAFNDNLEDIEVSGGGTAAGVLWTRDGRGNYWSAYPGYDRNGNGIGDIAYAPQPAFDSLTDTHPELQIFRYSPAAQAVQFAARTLPATAAQPKFVDAAPLMTPPDIAVASRANRTGNPVALLFALLAVAPIAAMRRAAGLHAPGRVRREPSPRKQTMAIEAAGVRKLYAPGRGICNVTLTVRAGESVALWGANGAGKTTFFRCVLGEKLDAGTLRVFGRVPAANERDSRCSIGYAPQYLPDFDERVSEIAEMVAALRGADRAEVDRVLQRVDLAGERNRFVTELSGGMRQRLSVALALIGDPPLLLLDEPTAGLDRESRDTIVALLNDERKRGKTLLLTSHVESDVSALADRVVSLERGCSS